MRVKGINRIKGRQPGVVYYYHRASGKRIDGEFGSPLFFENLARIERGHAAEKPQKGTLGVAIDAWRASPNWAALAPATRKGYERALLLMDGLREMPAHSLTRGFVLKMRDKKLFPKHGRWTANYAITVLALVCQHAADRELFGASWKNPLAERVRHIRGPKRAMQANRPWTPEECRVVLDKAPVHLAIPLALAMFAGFRKGDFLRVKMTDIKDGRISIRTSKRDTPVDLPIHAELDAILAKRPRAFAQEIALTSAGTPWTVSGFNASWRKFRAKLEKDGLIGKGLTPHGLRHTLGTRLREAGASDRDIADVLGQASTAMARHYSKNAAVPEKTGAMLINLEQARGKK